jgi:hypothetical protein
MDNLGCLGGVVAFILVFGFWSGLAIFVVSPNDPGDPLTLFGATLAGWATLSAVDDVVGRIRR